MGGAAGGLLLVAALGCGLLGCSGNAISSPDAGEMICTTIGCQDQFSATVTVDSTMVSAGRHTVTVTVDGAAGSCTFQIPPTAGLTNDPCTAPGFSITIGPAETCTTTQSATATSQQCQPIDGLFVERIAVNGTPKSIEVQQTVAGTVIFDQTVAPTYQTNQPNGPGCAPTCHQAGAEWTIP
jgi:hypothetical protein